MNNFLQKTNNTGIDSAFSGIRKDQNNEWVDYKPTVRPRSYLRVNKSELENNQDNNSLHTRTMDFRN